MPYTRDRQAALVALLLTLLVRAAGARAATTDSPIASGEAITVGRAVAIALQFHPAVQAAQAAANAESERVGEARAALLPQVEGVAQYLRATDNGIGSATYLSEPGFPRVPSVGQHRNQLSDTFNNYLAGLAAYQFLFDFGRTHGVVTQRRAEADAAEARSRLVQLDLVLQVTESYYDLLAARQIAHVFREAVEQRHEELQQAEVKSQAGLKPQIDTYTARAGLARANLELVDASNASAAAKITLDNAMGLGESAPEYTQSSSLSYAAVTERVDPLIKAALTQRPDLTFLIDQARAAGARIDQFRSDYLPTVGAAAGYSVRGQEDQPGNNYYAGLIVTWPIFGGFITDHEVAEAKFRQEAIEHDIRDLRQQVVLQVQRSFLSLQASVERVHQAEQALDASRVELELANKRYENGLGSIIELDDAQQAFTRDEAQHVQALAGFSVAQAALDRDTARGLPTIEAAAQ